MLPAWTKILSCGLLFDACTACAGNVRVHDVIRLSSGQIEP